MSPTLLPSVPLLAPPSDYLDPLQGPLDEYREWETTAVRNDKPGGYGTSEILKVTQILEGNRITCCLVGTSALIYYGASRVRGDWQICVPTDQLEAASRLLKSDAYRNDYIAALPFPIPQVGSLLHTYPRFKCEGIRLFFTLLPSRDCHIACERGNFQRSSNGVPYPKLNVFVQALLDTHDMVALCDVVDGTDVSEEWGNENLDLSGAGDVNWAIWKNKLIRGDMPFSLNEVLCCVVSRRATWEEVVRGKPQRLSWKFPKELFATKFRLQGSVDPWLQDRACA